MAKTEKIYVVEHGSYSDYEVDGIFTTRELAATFAERWNIVHPYDDALVVERELNPKFDVPKLRYTVKVDGLEFSNPGFTSMPEPTYAAYPSKVWYTPVYGGRYGGWLGQGMGETPEAAMKAAQDAVAAEKYRFQQDGPLVD